MQRRGILLVALIATLGAVSAFAFDPSELNKITFKNATGRKIQTIFLSPSDSGVWGPDIIGADYHLADGDSIGYYVHYPGSTFKFDILANDEAGNSFELYGYAFTDGKEAVITFTKKNLKGPGQDLNFVTLTIKNKTDKEMDYLFISPSDSDAWGVDLLDESSVLAKGDSYSVVIPVDAKVKYNVMAADENDDEYTFDMTIDPGKGKDFSVSIEPGDLDTGGSH